MSSASGWCNQPNLVWHPRDRASEKAHLDRRDSEAAGAEWDSGERARGQSQEAALGSKVQRARWERHLRTSSRGSAQAYNCTELGAEK